MDSRDLTKKIRKEFGEKTDTNGKGMYTIDPCTLPGNKAACDVTYKEYGAKTTYYPMVRVTYDRGIFNLRSYDELKTTNGTCTEPELADAITGAFALMKIAHKDFNEEVG